MHRNILLLIFITFLGSCLSNKDVIVVGHRGAMGHALENTVESVKKAIELNVDGIEIDQSRRSDRTDRYKLAHGAREDRLPPECAAGSSYRVGLPLCNAVADSPHLGLETQNGRPSEQPGNRIAIKNPGAGSRCRFYRSRTPQQNTNLLSSPLQRR